MRELSPNAAWILIQSSTSFEMVGTALSFPMGPVGEGEFTKREDCSKLAPVLREAVKRKLLFSLAEGDFAAYRRDLNLQTVTFRGLDIQPVELLLPSTEEDGSGGDAATEFLHQNGLRGVSTVDRAGWTPLHYAALAGTVEVISGLLQKRANLNKRTTKQEKHLGISFWMSALDLAILYKQNDAASLLIAARARLTGGMQPAMAYAAGVNNADGVRLLCNAGADPLERNIFGIPPFSIAAGYGAMAAVEEMRRQSRAIPAWELNHAIDFCVVTRGGTVDMVQHLLSLRADINHQYDRYHDTSHIGRLQQGLKYLQHRIGKPSRFSEFCYHANGRTPLMAALQSSQFEGAAVLIAAGARLDLTNDQKWTAADFAKGLSVPEFLQRGLKGDPRECQRVISLALSERFLEV